MPLHELEQREGREQSNPLVKQRYPTETGKMSSHRLTVFLGVLAGFLAICCCLLGGLLIWREFFREDAASTTEPPLTNITVMKERFPGYFRTPEEQEQFELNQGYAPVVQPVSNVSAVHSRCIFNGYCEISKNNSAVQGGPARRRRQVDTVNACALDDLPDTELTYHGCCVSYRDFIAPNSLPTGEPGQSGDVAVAQFGFLNQYFSIQECCQAKDCAGCQCAQTYYSVSAVVRRNGRYVTEYVRVPGCCQCLNANPLNGDS